MNLNFGCGSKIIGGYVNVDIVKREGVDKVFNFNKFPYPFNDNTFDYILAENIIEHLDNTKEVILELSRILKDNGVIQIKVPYYNHVCAYNDAEHTHYFNERTFIDLIEKKDATNKIILIEQKIKGGFFWRWIPEWIRVSIGHYISNINSHVELKIGKITVK